MTKRLAVGLARISSVTLAVTAVMDFERNLGVTLAGIPSFTQNFVVGQERWNLRTH
jgi:hypothetical protein